ncbi:hypothetical protein ACIBCH_20725 [Amycolatopsis thailandensis]|uniref:hypothetical protein n=1 Tax=Amycolatopsis thailandensis TaxID=589330 RepID=UPI00379F4CB5
MSRRNQINTMPPFPDAPPTSFVRREVRIHQRNGHTALFVDDLDIANTAFNVDISLGKGSTPTEVTVQLLPGALALEGADVVVKVDAATHAALLKLGWTPPGMSAFVYTDPDGNKTVFSPADITVAYPEDSP